MTYAEFIDKLNSGARWDVGVSINRSNSLPLDANSVFFSLADAQAYVAGTLEGRLANAYPGQLLAVVTEGATTIHYIDIDAEGVMSLKEVGAKVEADNASIEVVDGKVTISGFEAAAAATYPRKTADGKIEWVTVQELVEGATENTITVGDNKSITTVESDTGYTAKLVGFDDATAGQIAYKDSEGNLAWKNEYSYDDSSITSQLASVTAKVDTEGSVSSAIEAASETVLQEAADAADAKYVSKEGYVEFTSEEKEKLAGLENYDDTSITAQLGSLVSDVATVKGDYLTSDDKREFAQDYQELESRLAEVETFFETTEEGTLDAALDTLVEIQKYITDEGTAADQMLLDIQVNTSAISDIQTRVTAIEDEYLTSEDVAEFATRSELPDVSNFVTEEVIDEKDAAVLTAVTTDIASAVAAEKTRAEGAEKALADKVDPIADLASNKDVLVGITSEKVETWDNAQANAEATAAEELAKAVEAINSEIESEVGAVSSALSAYKTENDDAIAGLTEAVNAVDDKIDTAKQDVITDVLEQVDEKLTDYSTSTEIASQIGAAIAGVLVKSVDNTELSVTDGQLVIEQVAHNKINGLQKLTYTKDDEGHFVETKEAASLADILIAASYDPSSGKGQAGLMTPEDKEKLAKLILDDSGSVEVSGNVSVANVTGLPAYMNKKIDQIIIPGEVTPLQLTKSGEGIDAIMSVAIPLATETSAGLVKSSTAENTVGFQNGVGTVNNLNVNKLVQTDGEWLILDGGTATN